MSLPTSLALVGLVVLWLIVIVPMFAKKRQFVPRSSDGTGRFRVLKRTSSRKRTVRWGRSDETDFADLEPDVENGGDLRQQILETDDEYVAETAQYDDDLDSSYDDEVAEYDETAEYDEDFEAEAEYDEDLAESAEYDDAPTPLRAVGDPDVDEYDNERYRPVPVRHGRGGYDPDHAEKTRAYRFQRRRRVALTLLLLTLVSGLVGQLLVAPGWYACGVFGALLVGYLTYLRRQVKIEADISARRMERLRRARQIRPEFRETRRTGTRVPESRYDTRRQIVDLDDDDPAFDDLDTYHAPITYRRAVGE